MGQADNLELTRTILDATLHINDLTHCPAIEAVRHIGIGRNFPVIERLEKSGILGFPIMQCLLIDAEIFGNLRIRQTQQGQLAGLVVHRWVVQAFTARPW